MKTKTNLLSLNAIALGLSFWLLGCQSQVKIPQLITVPLNRVVSGQTVEVTLRGTTERVRIIGIDVSPEAKPAAKAQLQQLLSSSVIELEITNPNKNRPEKDRYDRIVAHLWQDNKLIAEELAKTGYVLANTKYPHKYRDRIWHAQEYARILDYGIWQD